MNPTVAVPRLRIEIDGSGLSLDGPISLEGVRVHQELSLPSQCELLLADLGEAPKSAPSLSPGSSLRLTLPGRDVPLFVGEITAVEIEYRPEGGRRVRARAYDPIHRLRKRQPVRAHLQMTIEDLAEEMVADVGLDVEAAETGPLSERLIQYRSSDFEFLAAAARRVGLYLTVRDQVLHLVTLEGKGDAVTLELGKSLLEARLAMNGDLPLRTVRATGWDSWRIELHQGEAGSARSGRDISAEVSPSQVGGTGERTLVEETLEDDHQADAIAQAELDRHAAGEVTLWGVAEGDPRLCPAIPVQLEGVDSSLEGRYVLTRVVHRIDSQVGYVTELSSEPPKAGPRARGATVVLATVKNVQDPESLGRIQLSLPTIGDLETGWFPVLVAGAGSGKGLMVFPDVGDQVLVLLPQGDPSQGIVLGGLYGTKSSPPATSVEGGNVRRYTLLTPGGARVLLDDEKKLLRLEHPGGSVLELAEDHVRLHSTADLTLEAPGRAVVIRGQTVDFRRA